MNDPNFERTIILMVQHNEDGAMGLVLNRPSSVAMKEAWRQVGEGDYAGDDVLFEGGPCPGPLMVLHTCAEAGDVHVCDGVWFTTQRLGIEQVIEASCRQASFFVGYAGWGVGQVESELAENVWFLGEPTQDLVFMGGELPWHKLIQKADPRSILSRVNPAILPDDPSLN